MSAEVIAAEPETQANEGWNRIFFHGFPAGVVDRFRQRFSHLGVRSVPLAAPIIPDGLVCNVRWGETDEATRHVGVYDANNREVEESIRLRDVPSSQSVAFAPPAEAQVVRDDRPAYYLGAEARPYGHVLLEAVCRAWAWDAYGEDRLAVLQCSPVPDYAQALFALIPGMAEHVHAVQSPTRFRDIIVPAPAFVIRDHAHVQMRLLAERMAVRALPKMPPKTEQPLYLTRSRLGSKARRIFVGEEEFESFLESQGFLVVAPETLPISEQIALFNRHKWIVASQGSACHSRLFALEPVNLVVLTNQLNPNFILCDMLARGSAHYGNVFEMRDFLGEAGFRFRRPVATEPVMLRRGACLDILRKLGLAGAKAHLPRSAELEDRYKQIWLENAYRHAQRKRDDEMHRALAQIAFQPERRSRA